MRRISRQKLKLKLKKIYSLVTRNQQRYFCNKQIWNRYIFFLPSFPEESYLPHFNPAHAMTYINSAIMKAHHSFMNTKNLRFYDKFISPNESQFYQAFHANFSLRFYVLMLAMCRVLYAKCEKRKKKL